MGHERIGGVPHTERWHAVISGLESESMSADDVAALAQTVLDNVQDRFESLHRDSGVLAAFQFLIALAKASHKDSLGGAETTPTIDLTAETTTLQLVKSLRAWVDGHSGSLEYADLAKKAAGDTIAVWAAEHAPKQTLFESKTPIREVWQRANTAAGFCTLSRVFFSRFTARYLNYFICREASSSSTSLADRDRLDVQLAEQIDGVSRFSFETARITQSFAAGWFNKHARDAPPTNLRLEGFLATAFGKMREDLSREGRR